MSRIQCRYSVNAIRQARNCNVTSNNQTLHLLDTCGDSTATAPSFILQVIIMLLSQLQLVCEDTQVHELTAVSMQTGMRMAQRLDNQICACSFSHVISRTCVICDDLCRALALPGRNKQRCVRCTEEVRARRTAHSTRAAISEIHYATSHRVHAGSQAEEEQATLLERMPPSAVPLLTRVM